jgi:transposase-like protein
MDGLSVADGPRARQEAFWNCIEQQVRKMVAQLIETVLKAQQQDQLAAEWNQRSTGRRGYRNGFYRRKLSTPHGPLQVAIPRCRDSGLDCSAVFDRYQRRIADVDRILRHSYLLGCSTRGTAELAEQVFGGTLSHQTVSRVMRWLDGQLHQWRRQPVEPAYKVVYIDGMHVDVLGQDRMVMLVAGQREGGRLEVLDFCVSTGEQCKELLQNLRRRGLENVQLFVSDQAGAIRHALEQVYPEVSWQSCTFHRLQALRAAVGPRPHRDLMVKMAGCIFRCPSRRAASDAAVAWARQWRQQEPVAVRQFMNGLEDSLMFYQMPQKWWRRVRTNNPLERLIRTLRMRLNNMGCFHDPPAVERAVFGQLARWHRLGTYTE